MSYKKISGIYAIRCITNNKIYVGSSASIKARWTSHLSDLRKRKHHNIHLQRAFDKYGESAFELEILEQTSDCRDVLSKAETRWMENLKSSNPVYGYNISAETKSPPIHKGSQHPRSKLLDEDVLTIVQKFSSGQTVSSIAREYKVARTCINSILYKGAWEHIERPLYIPRKIKKLTEVDVREIKKRLANREVYSILMKDYGISESTIISIIRGRTWKHVKVDVEPKPKKHFGKKITEEDVLQIKLRILAGDSYRSIARDYGVRDGTIRGIKNGEIWRGVAPEIDTTRISKPPKNKLSPEQVLEIKERLSKGESNTLIAKEYGVANSTISDIKHGKLWRHL